MAKQGSGGGSRKIGRNKAKCARYRLLDRRTTNKQRKQKRTNKSRRLPPPSIAIGLYWQYTRTKEQDDIYYSWAGPK